MPQTIYQNVVYTLDSDQVTTHLAEAGAKGFRLVTAVNGSKKVSLFYTREVDDKTQINITSMGEQGF